MTIGPPIICIVGGLTYQLSFYQGQIYHHLLEDNVKGKISQVSVIELSVTDRDALMREAA